MLTANEVGGRIGGDLSAFVARLILSRILKLLRLNLDVFIWTPRLLPDISKLRKFLNAESDERSAAAFATFDNSRLTIFAPPVG